VYRSGWDDPGKMLQRGTYSGETMTQLLIRYEMADLSPFALRELQQVDEKYAFIDRGQVCIHSRLNNHPLRIVFSGMNAPVASDFQQRLHGHRQVIVVPKSRIVARPLCAPVVVDDNARLAGAMIVTDNGPAICAVFATGEERDEPGRISVNLANGETIFHSRHSPIAYERWELAWMNERDEKMMSLTRQNE
jgi:hypothetical protein